MMAAAVLYRAHFVLYVREQRASTVFYRSVLAVEPTLDVPGMTEIPLPGGAILGLMPEAGITRLLAIVPPRADARAELYLMVDEPSEYHARALAAGGRELSALADRDWGHRVAYSSDLDGHVLAFARAR
jgi:hypothetical protein